MDERNMTPAEKRKLAALVEQMPTDLARGLRYGKTLSYVADMVQDGLSKGAWIFVGNEAESALEFNVSALTKDGYLTDENGLEAIACTRTTKAHRRYRDHLWTFAVYRSSVDV
jgi:hypothetical protein